MSQGRRTYFRDIARHAIKHGYSKKQIAHGLLRLHQEMYGKFSVPEAYKILKKSFEKTGVKPKIRIKQQQADQLGQMKLSDLI